MSLEWLAPYLLVATLVFLLPKLFGMIGKGNSAGRVQPAFAPHYAYVGAGIIMAGILLYLVAKVIHCPSWQVASENRTNGLNPPPPPRAGRILLLNSL